MKLIKLPNSSLIILASLLSWWLASVIHPGFNGIAIMFLLLIPIFIVEWSYAKPNQGELISTSATSKVSADENSV